MPRPFTDMHRRTITLDTGKRSLDIPVDNAGHIRRMVRLDSSSITRGATEEAAIGFKGHAAVFDKRAWIGSKRWGFYEEMAPTSFDKTLQESDTRFLHNHNPDLLLARTKAGTLRLSTDSVGLVTDADMAPTSYAKDLAISLERGDTTQMSFAFDMVSYEWRENPDGTETLRHLEVGPLYDVSTVTYPAYVETDASLRMDLLACARSVGLGDSLIGELAKRLANPDDELLESLRCLARGGQLLSGETETVSNENDPPVRTTDIERETALLHLRTIAARHKLVSK